MLSLLDLSTQIRTLICREDVLHRRDLARLSRSCKAWHEAANPVLWSYIRLTNLLRLLPEGAFSRARTSSSVALDALSAEHWAPLLKLSPLVKRLRFNKLSDDSVRSLIADSPPPTTLFPNLITLEFRDAPPKYVYVNERSAREFYRERCMFLEAIIPPHVSISTLDLENVFLDVFVYRSIPLNGNSLTRLRVDETVGSTFYDAYGPIGLRAFIRALSDMRHLLEVVLRLPFDRDPMLLEALSRLPALESLDLRLGCAVVRRGHWTRHAPAYSEGAFPALRRLYLNNGLSFVDAIDIIQCAPVTRRRPLQTLKVVCADADPSSALTTLTEVMRKHCSYEHLEEFTVDDFFVSFDWPLLSQHIAPLTAFSRLTKLYICPLGGTELTDDDCLQMARAWPNLRELDIFMNCEICPKEGIACTLASLAAFAEHCPQIRHINMNFTATNIPYRTTLVDAGDRRADPVEIPLQACVNITNGRDVAEFLVDVFDGMARVNLAYPEDFEDPRSEGATEEFRRRDDEWEEVRSLTLGCREEPSLP
ncbi:uncharacterized protein SCHCODRAFT_02742326 [Schizophyllum commune H4-8]|nr:uncharacterized protein SCHCODRAFT_02742326 [Schizophyllum commune H4-8]KAI5899200.1 hypothetical protein SCHCODRAFT_02742326 [Schizophyllum commune H4-8]